MYYFLANVLSHSGDLSSSAYHSSSLSEFISEEVHIVSSNAMFARGSVDQILGNDGCVL